MLRGLASPNMDVRRKILTIGLELVTPHNIEEFVLFLKKEITKTEDKGYEKVETSHLYNTECLLQGID